MKAKSLHITPIVWSMPHEELQDSMDEQVMLNMIIKPNVPHYPTVTGESIQVGTNILSMDMIQAHDLGDFYSIQ